MADVKLSNIANVTGTYDSVATALTSEAIITSMITGLTIVKTANKQICDNFYYSNSVIVYSKCRIQHIHILFHFLK